MVGCCATGDSGGLRCEGIKVAVGLCKLNWDRTAGVMVICTAVWGAEEVAVGVAEPGNVGT